MLIADLHTHTHFSHAAASPAAMRREAVKKNLKILGLSEHSPRPPAYAYPSDYQAKLRSGLPLFVEETLALKHADSPGFTTLLGLEADFLPTEISFCRETSAGAPYDYIIGGLHFQGRWGFDNRLTDWAALSQAEQFTCYARYYEDLAALCQSGIADIAAHPDLIKIFTPENFRSWLELPASLNLVRDALAELKKHDLLLELSSAGLRKPCREPYPGPAIMALAADLGLRLCISSDAHSTAHIAYAYDYLENYARGFGFTECWVVEKRQARRLPFDSA